MMRLAPPDKAVLRAICAREIIGQALGVMRRVTGRRLTNAVAMGQVNHSNYDGRSSSANLKLSGWFCYWCPSFDSSTCGLVEGIRRLSKEPEQFAWLPIILY